MIPVAPLPSYHVEDEAERLVLEASGYEATREAVRFVLLAGEEAGPLVTFTAAGRELERAELVDGAVVWHGRQGLRRSLR